MKTVKLINIKGSIAIVQFRDNDGILQCGIIDAQLVKGKEFEVSNTVIRTATPFGIDWSVVYPDGIVISSADLQEALYGMNIITLDDLRKNTVGVIAAINSLLKLSSGKLLNHARQALENAGGKK